MGASMVLPTELLASIRKTISPNDKIQVGLIGCKGMGFSDLSSMLQNSEVEVVALCDVDENVLREKTAELEKGGIKKPKWYSDYRKLLEDKDIHIAITIGEGIGLLPSIVTSFKACIILTTKKTI